MAETSDASVYPGIFGIEEELWVTYQRNGDAIHQCFAVHDLERALGDYQQAAGMLKPGQGPPVIFEAPHDMPGMRQFGTGGYREYVDGNNAERSIPQSTSIREAITRSRGVEQFAASLGRQLFVAHNDIQQIVHSRRVGFLGTDFVGTQDSLYAPQPDTSEGRSYHGRIERLLSAIAITRPYLTGAGDYYDGTNKQFVFSQKFRALSRLTFNQEPLVVAHTATGRVEVRQNDINICDAAAMMRVGGVAMGAAIAHTRLFGDFEDFILTASPRTNMVYRFNMPALDPHGYFMSEGNQELVWAAEQHMRLAEAFASNELLHQAGEQPPEMLEIAELIYETSDTMRQVLRGEEPLEAVQHASDWAAKQVQHLQNGDVDYDSTVIARNGGPGPSIQRTGVGFDLRDSGVFAGGISQAEVERLYATPPGDTNAVIRAAVIGNYVTNRVFWDRAEVPGFDEHGDPCEIKILFGGPDATELAESERQKLRRAIPLSAQGLPSVHGAGPTAGQASGGDIVTNAIYQVIDATQQDP